MEKDEKIRYVGVKQAVRGGKTLLKLGGVADLFYPSSTFRRGRVQYDGDVSPTLQTSIGVCRIMDKEMLTEKLNTEEPKHDVEEYLVKGFGIFKLSERECLRLMDVEDKHIDEMQKINSPTQLYKQAGNSIVVCVLCAIFSQLNIQDIKPWNERDLEEKHKLRADPEN